VSALDKIAPVNFEHVQIVGIDREAKILGRPIDQYMRIIEDAISKAKLGDPLKTQLLTSIDVVSYKGLSVVRIRIPRQNAPMFVGDDCFIRVGSSTKKASGPQISAITKLFR
jgi:predicted HTH transcriptional regulator